MLFILGSKEKITSLGSVYHDTCPHCHNQVNWKLTQITDRITFFFIPIFPAGSSFYLTCSSCSYSKQVYKDELIKLKKIMEFSNNFNLGKISQEEWEVNVAKLNRLDESKLNEEDIIKFKDVMTKKTTEELNQIVNFYRHDYQPGAVRAAERELQTRKIAE